MSTEIPYIQNALPAVSEDTFRSALYQYQDNRRLFNERVYEEVGAMVRGFEPYVEMAVACCDVDPNAKSLASDYMYAMGTLLCRQFVVDYRSAEFACELDAHTSSPSPMPPQAPSADIPRYLRQEKHKISPLPPLIFTKNTAQEYLSIPVLETKGLVETRPRDAMNYFFSGDYFLDNLYAADRRLVGESTLRLYGLLNRREKQAYHQLPPIE
jgi:hypothetical protein